MVEPGFVQSFLLGCGVGVAAKTVVAPIQRSSYLLQFQDHLLSTGQLDKPYTGLSNVIVRVVREEGVSGLWRSSGVFRYGSSQGLNLALKEQIKATLGSTQENGLLSWHSANLASGGFAGVLSLLMTYPIEFSRARLARDLSEQRMPLMDRIIHNYRGFGAASLHIFVFRSCYFGVYDSVKPSLPSALNNTGGLFSLGFATSNAAFVVSSPILVTRLRVMRDRHTSHLQCARDLLKADGFLGFFRGATQHFLVRGIAGGLVLAGFDVAMHLYTHRHSSD
eukprot:m.62439 g.62439  ORF g.62439 m.62439 type:complete len:279 (+) comp11912_c0_seq2:67-903(+)